MSEGLTNKQQAFIEHYLTCWNATEAARRASYAYPNVEGPKNLVKPSIAAIIRQRLAEFKMGADEVLARLSDQARGSLDDFIDVSEPGHGIEGATDVIEAKAIAGGWKLNLVKAEQRGKLHLLKKIKSGQWGPEIELYDAQAALALLGRHHKLFTDMVEHGGKVEVEYVNDWRQSPE